MKRLQGQPTKFNRLNLPQVEKLYKSGFTDKEVSDFYSITTATLNNYKKSHTGFFAALKEWKKYADDKVERSLYQRAIGYEFDEVTYEKSKIGGLGVGFKGEDINSIKRVDTYKTKVTVKQIAPDVTAQIFWLKNRQPDRWRDRREDFDGKQETHYHYTSIELSSKSEAELLEILMGRNGFKREPNPASND